MLDLLELVKPNNCEIAYIFFDTGLEFHATKQHLCELEKKYDIIINRRRAKVTVAAACRKYGVPFISKDASEFISRLQTHSFDWNDSPDEATTEKYGRCKSALDWYFNSRQASTVTGKSKYGINKYRLLKEFIQSNPPNFDISDKCCNYAKKAVARDFEKECEPDLIVNGMRRAEGGRRIGAIRTCFSPSTGKVPDSYRPIWFWTNEDRLAYKSWRDMRYSDCYEVYGLKRTGCVGCPCNSKAATELALAEPFEPYIVRAAYNIFGVSYDYKQQYIEFKSKK
jgi:3'-phosphoadenosine 5'-phosphosulfate sulfotransferase (PAPS reductase)/FAD synthetase